MLQNQKTSLKNPIGFKRICITYIFVFSIMLIPWMAILIRISIINIFDFIKKHSKIFVEISTNFVQSILFGAICYLLLRNFAGSTKIGSFTESAIDRSTTYEVLLLSGLAVFFFLLSCFIVFFIGEIYKPIKAYASNLFPKFSPASSALIKNTYILELNNKRNQIIDTVFAFCYQATSFLLNVYAFLASIYYLHLLSISISPAENKIPIVSKIHSMNKNEILLGLFLILLIKLILNFSKKILKERLCLHEDMVAYIKYNQFEKEKIENLSKKFEKIKF